MLTSLETGIGLDIVVWLQALNHPALDVLAKLLHTLGSDLVYLVLLPIIYWSVNRQLGRRMLLVLLLSIVAVNVAKLTIQAPRPHQAAPEDVTALVEQDGYGLPSGHVANAMAVFGYLAISLRRRWLTIFTVVFVGLMAWSRMYAGVHYPQDVIAGLVIGGLIVFAVTRYEAIFNRIGDYQRSTTWPLRLAVIGLIVALLAVVMWNSPDIEVAGVVFGSGLGLIAEETFVNFSVKGTSRQRILRSALGLLFGIGLFYGIRIIAGDSASESVPSIVRYSLTTAFMLAVWPALCIRFGLMERESSPDSVEVQAIGSTV